MQLCRGIFTHGGLEHKFFLGTGLLGTGTGDRDRALAQGWDGMNVNVSRSTTTRWVAGSLTVLMGIYDRRDLEEEEGRRGW